MMLAKRLRQCRERKALSQKRLGELVRMTQQAIDKIETGDVKMPRKIEAIAAVLDVSPEYLLYGRNPPPWVTEVASAKEAASAEIINYAPEWNR
jgi:transcriptional regulator with XRE-family HTH domain